MTRKKDTFYWEPDAETVKKYIDAIKAFSLDSLIAELNFAYNNAVKNSNFDWHWNYVIAEFRRRIHGSK